MDSSFRADRLANQLVQHRVSKRIAPEAAQDVLASVGGKQNRVVLALGTDPDALFDDVSREFHVYLLKPVWMMSWPSFSMPTTTESCGVLMGLNLLAIAK